MTCSFHDLYENFACALVRADDGDRGWRAYAAERIAMLDDAWHRLSQLMPPAASLGCVRLTPLTSQFFRHTVWRQAVQPDVINTELPTSSAIEVRW